MIQKYKINADRVAIWCDYACIEQDDPEQQKLGIASLISYAARSDLIITPVQTEPTAMTAFAAASHPADLVNYGERAWCRLSHRQPFHCLLPWVKSRRVVFATLLSPSCGATSGRQSA